MLLSLSSMLVDVVCMTSFHQHVRIYEFFYHIKITSILLGMTQYGTPLYYTIKYILNQHFCLNSDLAWLKCVSNRGVGHSMADLKKIKILCAQIVD